MKAIYWKTFFLFLIFHKNIHIHNCFSCVILICSQNICFHGETKKIFIRIQSNFNGSNIFGAIEISSR